MVTMAYLVHMMQKWEGGSDVYVGMYYRNVSQAVCQMQSVSRSKLYGELKKECIRHRLSLCDMHSDQLLPGGPVTHEATEGRISH